eukprot:11698806-Alexandrium_andersonii.AAC.1
MQHFERAQRFKQLLALPPWGGYRPLPHQKAHPACAPKGRFGGVRGAVSYTHLTLPTICSV